MDINIRFAEERDYNPLCVLSEQGDRLHREQLPHLFHKPDGPAREWEYIYRLLEDESTALFVTELGDNLVGYINVMLLRSGSNPLLKPRCYAVIDNLIVDEDHRMMGVGSALMARAETWAKEKGAASMELNVYHFNQAAQALYEQLGYEVVSSKLSKSLAN